MVITADVIVGEAEALQDETSIRQSASSDDEPPSTKFPKLFASYKRLGNCAKMKSAAAQLTRYLDIINDQELKAIEFWNANKPKLDILL